MLEELTDSCTENDPHPKGIEYIQGLFVSFWYNNEGNICEITAEGSMCYSERVNNEE